MMKKTEKMRKIYYWERLRHWYPLLVNKFREKKGRKTEDLKYDTNKVVKIQSWFRGEIVRKKTVFWKKKFKDLVNSKSQLLFYLTKKKLWNEGLNNENYALNFSKISEEDIFSFISYSDKQKDDETISDMVKFKEKTELDTRVCYLGYVKLSRNQALE